MSNDRQTFCHWLCRSSITFDRLFSCALRARTHVCTHVHMYVFDGILRNEFLGLFREKPSELRNRKKYFALWRNIL